jgi:hypothetical protein
MSELVYFVVVLFYINVEISMGTHTYTHTHTSQLLTAPAQQNFQCLNIFQEGIRPGATAVVKVAA